MFNDFVQFIRNEREIASDPTFSKLWRSMLKVLPEKPSNNSRTLQDSGRPIKHSFYKVKRNLTGKRFTYRHKQNWSSLSFLYRDALPG